MLDNIHVYTIDCSIDKKGNIIIYEIQPFMTSLIGPDQPWDFIKAFKEKFSDFDILIKRDEDDNITDKLHRKKLLIKNTRDVSEKEFNDIKTGKYDYVHTLSHEYEAEPLNSKVHQRLYLPTEVSPKHLILKTSLETEKLKEIIFHYCEKESIQSIVLKSGKGNNYKGEGNYFIFNINDSEAIKQAISFYKEQDDPYFLVEQIVIFPHISRKTNKERKNWVYDLSYYRYCKSRR